MKVYLLALVAIASAVTHKKHHHGQERTQMLQRFDDDMSAGANVSPLSTDLPENYTDYTAHVLEHYCTMQKNKDGKMVKTLNRKTAEQAMQAILFAEGEIKAGPKYHQFKEVVFPKAFNNFDCADGDCDGIVQGKNIIHLLDELRSIL